MSESDSTKDRQKEAHKYFGIELHNKAYDHADKFETDPEEGERALHAAFGSLYHWAEVGTAIHFARGELTIASIALKVNRHEVAIHHAKRCLRLVEENGFADWDLAYAYETYARANAANGNTKLAVEYKQKAIEAGKAIAEEGDRKQFESDLNSGNWYGI